MVIKCQFQDNHLLANCVSKVLSTLAYNPSKINEFDIHIITDTSNLLENFRFYLINWNLLKTSRFIFIDDIHLHKSPSKATKFWRNILLDIGIAKIVECSESQNLLFEIIKTINEFNDLKDQASLTKILKSIFPILISLQAAIAEESSLKEVKIDELDDPEYIIHNLEPKDRSENTSLRHLFFSYIEHALFDWIKNNRWIFFSEKIPNFKLLIIDDLISMPEWPFEKNENNKREKKLKDELIKCVEILNSGTLKWEIFRLVRTERENFVEFIENVIKNEKQSIIYRSILRDTFLKKGNLLDQRFTHILIDWNLNADLNYSGFNLLRDLKNLFLCKSSREKIIPEFIVFSRNDDPATVQSAFNAGASGFVIKDRAYTLPFVLGRAGECLKKHEHDEIEDLLMNNFPCLHRFPSYVQKDLYSKKIPELNLEENRTDYNRENWINWINEVPKTDLHVHFGVAIPIETCYDVAAISVFQWTRSNKGNPKIREQVKFATDIITAILNKVHEQETKNKTDNNQRLFRQEIIEAAQDILETVEITSPNDIIALLDNKLSDLSEEHIACLFIVGLGFAKGRIWENSLSSSKDTLLSFLNVCNSVNNSKTDSFGNFGNSIKIYQKNCRSILDNIYKLYSERDVVSDIIKEINEIYDDDIKLVSNKDPLSQIVSIPDGIQREAQGLIKYLGGSDFLGASLLQFSDTVLLASISIPVWAAKANVWHSELRVDPLGFMKNFKNPNRGDIITKLILLGLTYGIHSNLEKRNKIEMEPVVTASLLLTAKRDKKKEIINTLLVLASDMNGLLQNTDFEDCNNLSIIPRVAGIDLAGLERGGHSPWELKEYFQEAFKKCLLLSAHAGEDESVTSIYGSIYELHAARIGHGLRLLDDKRLMNLVRDRSILVELCPKSNQFTNGYLKGKNPYVLENYIKHGIPVSINTDDPLLSHSLDENDKYPLAKEFMILPNMVEIDINRLQILKLIWNGFIYAFLPPKCKHLIQRKADFSLFNIIAKEYLDVPSVFEHNFS